MKIYKVFGAPGTGKTKWIENQVSQDLQNGIRPNEIVLSSFTNAAIREILKRVVKYNRIKEFIYCKTLHSIFYQQCIMRNIIPKKSGLFENHIWDFNKIYNRNITTLMSDYTSIQTDDDEEYLQYCIRRNRGIQDTDNLLEMQIQAYKESTGYIEFIDMLWKALEHDAMPMGIKKVYIDESQDLSDIQACLTLKLAQANDADLYYVGDDDQAIYGFGGATVDHLLTDYGTENIILNQSYRLPPKILDIAMQVIKYIPDDKRQPKQFRSIDIYGEGELGILNLDEVIDFVKDKISQDYSVMILGRTRFLFYPKYTGILDALLDNGILYNNYYSDNPVFSMIKDDRVLTFLKIIDSLADGYNVHRDDIYIIFETLSSKAGIMYGAKSKKDEILVKELYSLDELRINGIINYILADAIKQKNYDYFDGYIINNQENKWNVYKEYYRRYGKDMVFKAGRVIPGTIHSVKGGEADYVVIMPYYSEKIERAMQESIDNYIQEIKTIYVGITRARRGVYLLNAMDTDKIYNELTSLFA